MLPLIRVVVAQAQVERVLLAVLEQWGKVRLVVQGILPVQVL